MMCGNCEAIRLSYTATRVGEGAYSSSELSSSRGWDGVGASAGMLGLVGEGEDALDLELEDADEEGVDEEELDESDMTTGRQSASVGAVRR